MKSNFTRRDFLKASLLGLGATFLAACKKVIGVTETAVAPIETGIEPVETQPPVETEPPVVTEPPTVEPTESPTENPCFKLLTPEDGAQLPAIGKATFSWEPMPGAASYELQVTLPTTQIVTFKLNATTYVRYLESFPMGGTFTWQVAALDENSAVICITEFFAFDKEEKQKNKNNDGNGNNGGEIPTMPPPTEGPGE